MKSDISAALMMVALLDCASMAYGWSPSNSYAPANVSCPSDNFNLIREASELSNEETSWLLKRDEITSPILEEWLSNRMGNVSNSKSLLSSIFHPNSSNSSSSSSSPRIGIACSGGGYRAMLSGAGMLSALDNRTTGANEHGLGGILQSSTYLAGLSGGNWLVGTLAFNNWTSVQNIIDNTTASDSIWDISNSIIDPKSWNIFGNIDRWNTISDDVYLKKDAGFNISLTDVWGRALSYNFFPSLKEGGDAYTWSTLKDVDVFKNAEMPFVISVADGRYPDTLVVDTNSTLFEFNPYEMGSWDPSVNSFANIKYVGTNVTNGSPVIENTCVEGFDNTAFIMGTSSSLFNQFLLRMNSTSIPSFLKSFLLDFLNDLHSDSDDISLFAPNPFYGSKYYQNNITAGSIANSKILYLVDGGEDGQNVPLVPLLQKKRNVDVIFALDNSADTDYYWPSGGSLVSTYERQFGLLGSDLSFPYVPDRNTFLNNGLADKPAFFGCDASNLTSLSYIPPLIIYVPNNMKSYSSNTSTFKMAYSDSTRLKMIKNGFEVMSRNNLTDDSNFDVCVSCAIIRRSQERQGLTLPSECEQCFKDYCWNGSINSTMNTDDPVATGSSSIVFITTTGTSSDGSLYTATVATAASSQTSTKKSKNIAAPVAATNISLTGLMTFIISITLGFF